MCLCTCVCVCVCACVQCTDLSVSVSLPQVFVNFAKDQSDDPLEHSKDLSVRRKEAVMGMSLLNPAHRPSPKTPSKEVNDSLV